MGKSDVLVYSALPCRQTSRTPSKVLVTRNDNKVHHNIDYHHIQNTNGQGLIDESDKDEAQCFPCQCPILSRARVILSSMKTTSFGNNSLNRSEMACYTDLEHAMPLDQMPFQGSHQPIASSSAMNTPITAPLKSTGNDGEAYNQSIKTASIAQPDICVLEVQAS